MGAVLATYALIFLLANAALKLTLIVRWVRLERPETPLLKPVTLCAAASTVGLRVLEFSRHARQLSFETLGHVSDREQMGLKTTEKRIQDYV